VVADADYRPYGGEEDGTARGGEDENSEDGAEKWTHGPCLTRQLFGTRTKGTRGVASAADTSLPNRNL
jgi:hypothetical protein